ncbi:MAG: glutathione-dependent formaldehyde dehydrogenase, partial [Thermoanaerobaculia bacterium]|nr:glutathione-dependent formaldehyde dehydrogenase [Thermoanaerobaculia bacterium]
LARLLPRLAAGELRPERIISHRLVLADGPRAYDLFDRKLDRCVKVVLTP